MTKPTAHSGHQLRDQRHLRLVDGYGSADVDGTFWQELLDETDESLVDVERVTQHTIFADPKVSARNGGMLVGDLPDKMRIEVCWGLSEILRGVGGGTMSPYARMLRALVNHVRSAGHDSLLELDVETVASELGQRRARDWHVRMYRRTAYWFVGHLRRRAGIAAGRDNSSLLAEIHLDRRDRVTIEPDLPVFRVLGKGRNWKALPLFDVHEDVRVELLWAIDNTYRHGMRLINTTFLRGVLAVARDRYLTSLTDLSDEEWTSLLVGKHPKSKVVRNRTAGGLAHIVHPVRIARSRGEREWWEHDLLGWRFDPDFPNASGVLADERMFDLRRFQVPWLREAYRWWLSRSLIRDSLAATTLHIVLGHCVNFVEPWIIKETNGQPSLLDGDPDSEDFLDLVASLNDHLEEHLAAGGPRTHISSMLRFVHSSKRAAAAVCGADLDQLPDAFAYWLAEEPEHSDRASAASRVRRNRGERPVNVYLDDVATSGILAVASLLGTPKGTPASITLPSPTGPVTYEVNSGFGRPDLERIWQILAATGRRWSDATEAPWHQPFEPLKTDKTIRDQIEPEGDEFNADAYADSETDEDPFVCRWFYGTVKIDSDEYKSIPIRRSVRDLIVRQREFALAFVQERVPDATPEILFPNPHANNFRGKKQVRSDCGVPWLRALGIRVFDGAGIEIEWSRTHQHRVTTAVNLIDAGAPLPVAQNYLGHASVDMTAQYHRTRDEVLVRELEKVGIVGADGVQSAVEVDQFREILYLTGKADRVLPNGVCLLPPTATCDVGNKCLTCPSFGTSVDFIDVHLEQRESQAALIETTTRRFEERHGRPMPADNPWLINARKDLASLESIIAALDTSPEAAVARAEAMLPMINTQSGESA